jgi:hypothetical protein
MICRVMLGHIADGIGEGRLKMKVKAVLMTIRSLEGNEKNSLHY